MGLIFKNFDDLKKDVKILRKANCLPEKKYKSIMAQTEVDNNAEILLKNSISELDSIDLDKLIKSDNYYSKYSDDYVKKGSILNDVYVKTYISDAKRVIILNAYFAGNAKNKKNISFNDLYDVCNAIIKENQELILENIINNKTIEKQFETNNKKAILKRIKNIINDDKDIKTMFKLSVLESIVFQQNKNIIFLYFTKMIFKKCSKNNKKYQELKEDKIVFATIDKNLNDLKGKVNDEILNYYIREVKSTKEEILQDCYEYYGFKNVDEMKKELDKIKLDDAE